LVNGFIADSCFPLLGAKGKFSGGFDISAFGGLQEAKEGTSIYYGSGLGSFNCNYHTNLFPYL
jgi:hypothetical protein